MIQPNSFTKQWRYFTVGSSGNKWHTARFCLLASLPEVFFVIQDAKCIHFKQIKKELPVDDRKITPEQHELFLDLVMR